MGDIGFQRCPFLFRRFQPFLGRRSQDAHLDGIEQIGDTFGTNKVTEEVIQSWVTLHVDLRPGAITERLKLRRPIYEKTAAYGHFGREDFPWEQLDETLLAELKKLL